MKKRENQRVSANLLKTFLLRADGNTALSVAEESSIRPPAYCVSVAIHRPEITGQREKRRGRPRLF